MSRALDALSTDENAVLPKRSIGASVSSLSPVAAGDTNTAALTERVAALYRLSTLRTVGCCHPVVPDPHDAAHPWSRMGGRRVGAASTSSPTFARRTSTVYGSLAGDSSANASSSGESDCCWMLPLRATVDGSGPSYACAKEVLEHLAHTLRTANSDFASSCRLARRWIWLRGPPGCGKTTLLCSIGRTWAAAISTSRIGSKLSRSCSSISEPYGSGAAADVSPSCGCGAATAQNFNPASTPMSPWSAILLLPLCWSDLMGTAAGQHLDDDSIKAACLETLLAAVQRMERLLVPDTPSATVPCCAQVFFNDTEDGVLMRSRTLVLLDISTEGVVSTEPGVEVLHSRFLSFCVSEFAVVVLCTNAFHGSRCPSSPNVVCVDLHGLHPPASHQHATEEDCRDEAEPPACPPLPPLLWDIFHRVSHIPRGRDAVSFLFGSQVRRPRTHVALMRDLLLPLQHCNHSFVSNACSGDHDAVEQALQWWCCACSTTILNEINVSCVVPPKKGDSMLSVVVELPERRHGLRFQFLCCLASCGLGISIAETDPLGKGRPSEAAPRLDPVDARSCVQIVCPASIVCACAAYHITAKNNQCLDRMSLHNIDAVLFSSSTRSSTSRLCSWLVADAIQEMEAPEEGGTGGIEAHSIAERMLQWTGDHQRNSDTAVLWECGSYLDVLIVRMLRASPLFESSLLCPTREWTEALVTECQSRDDDSHTNRPLTATVVNLLRGEPNVPVVVVRAAAACVLPYLQSTTALDTKQFALFVLARAIVLPTPTALDEDSDGSMALAIASLIDVGRAAAEALGSDDACRSSATAVVLFRAWHEITCCVFQGLLGHAAALAIAPPAWGNRARIHLLKTVADCLCQPLVTRFADVTLCSENRVFLSLAVSVLVELGSRSPTIPPLLGSNLSLEMLLSVSQCAALSSPLVVLHILTAHPRASSAAATRVDELLAAGHLCAATELLCLIARACEVPPMVVHNCVGETAHALDDVRTTVYSLLHSCHAAIENADARGTFASGHRAVESSPQAGPAVTADAWCYLWSFGVGRLLRGLLRLEKVLLPNAVSTPRRAVPDRGTGCATPLLRGAALRVARLLGVWLCRAPMCNQAVPTTATLLLHAAMRCNQLFWGAWESNCGLLLQLIIPACRTTTATAVLQASHRLLCPFPGTSVGRCGNRSCPPLSASSDLGRATYLCHAAAVVRKHLPWSLDAVEWLQSLARRLRHLSTTPAESETRVSPVELHCVTRLTAACVKACEWRPAQVDTPISTDVDGKNRKSEEVLLCVSGRNRRLAVATATAEPGDVTPLAYHIVVNASCDASGHCDPIAPVLWDLVLHRRNSLSTPSSTNDLEALLSISAAVVSSDGGSRYADLMLTLLQQQLARCNEPTTSTASVATSPSMRAKVLLWLRRSLGVAAIAENPRFPRCAVTVVSLIRGGPPRPCSARQTGTAASQDERHSSSSAINDSRVVLATTLLELVEACIAGAHGNSSSPKLQDAAALAAGSESQNDQMPQHDDAMECASMMRRCNESLVTEVHRSLHCRSRRSSCRTFPLACAARWLDALPLTGLHLLASVSLPYSSPTSTAAAEGHQAPGDLVAAVVHATGFTSWWNILLWCLTHVPVQEQHEHHETVASLLVALRRFLSFSSWFAALKRCDDGESISAELRRASTEYLRCLLLSQNAAAGDHQTPQQLSLCHPVAVEWLTCCLGTEVVRELILHAEHGRRRSVRAAALHVLAQVVSQQPSLLSQPSGTFGMDALSHTIVQALHDRSARVRSAALLALCRIEEPDCFRGRADRCWETARRRLGEQLSYYLSPVSRSSEDEKFLCRTLLWRLAVREGSGSESPTRKSLSVFPDLHETLLHPDTLGYVHAATASSANRSPSTSTSRVLLLVWLRQACAALTAIEGDEVLGASVAGRIVDVVRLLLQDEDSRTPSRQRLGSNDSSLLEAHMHRSLLKLLTTTAMLSSALTGLVDAAIEAPSAWECVPSALLAVAVKAASPAHNDTTTRLDACIAKLFHLVVDRCGGCRELKKCDDFTVRLALLTSQKRVCLLADALLSLLLIRCATPSQHATMSSSSAVYLVVEHLYRYGTASGCTHHEAALRCRIAIGRMLPAFQKRSWEAEAALCAMLCSAPKEFPFAGTSDELESMGFDVILNHAANPIAASASTSRRYLALCACLLDQWQSAVGPWGATPLPVRMENTALSFATPTQLADVAISLGLFQRPFTAALQVCRSRVRRQLVQQMVPCVLYSSVAIKLCGLRSSDMAAFHQLESAAVSWLDSLLFAPQPCAGLELRSDVSDAAAEALVEWSKAGRNEEHGGVDLGIGRRPSRNGLPCSALRMLSGLLEPVADAHKSDVDTTRAHLSRVRKLAEFVADEANRVEVRAPVHHRRSDGASRGTDVSDAEALVWIDSCSVAQSPRSALFVQYFVVHVRHLRQHCARVSRDCVLPQSLWPISLQACTLSSHISNVVMESPSNAPTLIIVRVSPRTVASLPRETELLPSWVLVSWLGACFVHQAPHGSPASSSVSLMPEDDNVAAGSLVAQLRRLLECWLADGGNPSVLPLLRFEIWTPPLAVTTASNGEVGIPAAEAIVAALLTTVPQARPSTPGQSQDVATSGEVYGEVLNRAVDEAIRRYQDPSPSAIHHGEGTKPVHWHPIHMPALWQALHLEATRSWQRNLAVAATPVEVLRALPAKLWWCTHELTQQRGAEDPLCVVHEDDYHAALAVSLRRRLLCAYAASVVVASGMVDHCVVSPMGTVGAVLGALGSAVPVVGGAVSGLGAALRTVDHMAQAQRVVNLSTIAPTEADAQRLIERIVFGVQHLEAVSPAAMQTCCEEDDGVLGDGQRGISAAVEAAVRFVSGASTAQTEAICMQAQTHAELLARWILQWLGDGEHHRAPVGAPERAVDVAVACVKYVHKTLAASLARVTRDTTSSTGGHDVNEAPTDKAQTTAVACSASVCCHQ